ncbi:MAG: acyl-CoA thioesterase [Spirochaetia bacterium]|nr:acyl-CoA thioesterase [Spirochaetia bacterium]
MKIRPLSVEAEIPIRAYDIDAMGYVSNIVYIRWFEDLRHVFLDKHYPFEQMISDGKSPVLMHTEIDYRRPLTIQNKPAGTCWMEKVGRTKWEMHFEILQDSDIYCTGIQIGYFMDLKRQRPTKLPDSMINAYKKEHPAQS